MELVRIFYLSLELSRKKKVIRRDKLIKAVDDSAGYLRFSHEMRDQEQGIWYL